MKTDQPAHMRRLIRFLAVLSVTSKNPCREITCQSVAQVNLFLPRRQLNSSFYRGTIDVVSSIFEVATEHYFNTLLFRGDEYIIFYWSVY